MRDIITKIEESFHFHYDYDFKPGHVVDTRSEEQKKASKGAPMVADGVPMLIPEDKIIEVRIANERSKIERLKEEIAESEKLIEQLQKDEMKKKLHQGIGQSKI